MASPQLRQLFLSPPRKSSPSSPFNFKSHLSFSSSSNTELPPLSKDAPDRASSSYERAKNYKQASSKKHPQNKDDPPDPVKAALAKALEYKKNKNSVKPANTVTAAPIEQKPTEPQVEILIGDTSKFGYSATPAPPTEDESFDLYKPKVSTWGVFPRPENISKTYGGGRNINPGDALETREQRAEKDKRTKAAIAAYKKKIGLLIDPKIVSECQNILNHANSLMDSGNLRHAIVNYEQVMNKLPFQNELHGVAALQWSVCKDSLSRGEEARAMYEKLQSHPNGQVRKKANHFVYSFQAMSMMKVTASDKREESAYQKYFDAFVEDKMVYADAAEGNSLTETLPYILVLFSPVVFVFLLTLLR